MPLLRPPSFPLQLGCVVLLAIVARLLAASIWWAETESDPDVYVALAQGLAEGKGYSKPGTEVPTAYRPPGYPLLLSPFVTHSPEVRRSAIVGLNIVFDLVSLCCAMLAAACVPGLKHRAGLVGCLLACDPLMLRYTSQPMTEACFTAWSTAGLLGLACWVTRTEAANAGATRGLVLCSLTGGLFGIAALVRPSVWPFLGLCTAALALRKLLRPELRPHFRKTTLELLTFLATLGVVVSPWAFRNLLVFGTPRLTTTHGGYTLLLANNPVFYREVAEQPWGTTWDGDSLNRWQTAMLAEMDRALGPAASEIEKDRWQSQQAWRTIQQDPAGFTAGAWYRVRSFWSLAPRGPQATGSGWLSAAVRGWYLSLFIAAAVGSVLLWRARTPGLWIPLLSIAALQTVHLFYWTDTRMRLPIHPLLAVLAVAGLSLFLKPTPLPDRRDAPPAT